MVGIKCALLVDILEAFQDMNWKHTIRQRNFISDRPIITFHNINPHYPFKHIGWYYYTGNTMCIIHGTPVNEVVESFFVFRSVCVVLRYSGSGRRWVHTAIVISAFHFSFFLIFLFSYFCLGALNALHTYVCVCVCVCGTSIHLKPIIHRAFKTYVYG